jgi:hypothetical protein
MTTFACLDSEPLIQQNPDPVWTWTYNTDTPIDAAAGLLVLVVVQCTKYLKHIFPERKLHGLVPNFYIHLGAIYILYSRDQSYLEYLFSCIT